ncbi:hypothetical protein CDAR_11141 [Caerostris darwini]|uniref:Uncharacterized protein n=1 Tax=Caerostris darwini TaxID=1538125 RepID=A0AAV4S9F3_9ARAC|nr:hypothetical protein CDAR_11141 [Caerostris darwini]
MVLDLQSYVSSEYVENFLSYAETFEYLPLIDFVRWNCLPALFPDTPCSITLCNFEQWRSRQRLGANGGEIVRPLSADDLLSQTMQKGAASQLARPLTQTHRRNA